MDEKDLQIDNILETKEKKKKVDGKAKGDRTELHLCKLLSDHFGVEFTKAMGSGARWSQVRYLPEHAKKTLTGDICVPEGFKWVVESKGGYEDKVDLNNVCDGPIAQLDEFIEQSSRDAEYCKRKPIICWKRNRKPWLAVVRLSDIENVPEYYVVYGTWAIVPLRFLLECRDRTFWFEEGK